MKRVIIEELLRSMAVFYFTMMGWAYLGSRDFLPVSGYSFAAVALGIPFLSFWILLGIRLKTEWELKLRSWRGWIAMALFLGWSVSLSTRRDTGLLAALLLLRS